MSECKLMPEISPHYLQALAPYTSGNTTLTEALNGAADRIVELEAEIAGMIEVERDNYKRSEDALVRLEAEVALLEGRKVIDMLKYVDSLERKVINLTDENKELRGLFTMVGQLARAALQEQGDE